jgi:hypothetical protein
MWFHEDGIANILSLARVKEKYQITYDSSDGNKFRIHCHDRTYQLFHESTKALYFMDGNEPLVATVLVNTVSNNKASKYTQCDYSQAVLACKLQKVIEHPSLRDYVHMMKNNLILNSPITVQDIMAAEHSFGLDIGFLSL